MEDPVFIEGVFEGEMYFAEISDNGEGIRLVRYPTDDFLKTCRIAVALSKACQKKEVRWVWEGGTMSTMGKRCTADFLVERHKNSGAKTSRRFKPGFRCVFVIPICGRCQLFSGCTSSRKSFSR